MNGAMVVALAVAGATTTAWAGNLGACCLPSGTCVPDVTEDVCNTFEGVFQGEGTDCADIDCIGACCLPSGECQDASEAACIALGGDYQGNGIECLSVDCPLPTGACCLADESCIEVEEAACAAQDGVFRGIGASCDDVVCTGACCLPDGTVTEGSSQQCDDLGGSFQGFGTEGESTYCGMGACVLPNGACTDVVVFDCDLAAGWHLGADSLCETAIAQVHGYSFELSPGMQTFTFDTFDTQEQTRLLERVTFVSSGCISAEITVHNDGTIPIAVPTIVFEGLLTYSYPCWPPIQFSLPGIVRGPEGVTIPPGEWWSYGIVEFCHDDYLAETVDPGVLPCYIAPPPTIEATVIGSGAYDFAGEAEISFMIADFHAEGEIGLVYEYTAAGACCMCDGTCIESMDRESCESMPGARAWIAGGSCADGVCACPADLDGSGTVDTADLLALLAAWGDDGPADLNCDDTVDTADLLDLLAGWGDC
jgi:hypothetical protein